MLKQSINGVQSRLSLHFKSLILYSTSSIDEPSPHFMFDYLVKSLGFSKESAISASTKVSHLKSTENPNSVVEFFKQLGLDSTQVRNLISSIPNLLLANVEKTLKPKIRVFQDLGFAGSDLVDVVSANPSIITRGLDSHILPSIKFLRTLLKTDVNVAKAIKRSNWLLCCNIPKRMQPNVVLLESYGLPKEKIRKFVVQNPRYLLHNPDWLEKSLGRVEEKFGIPPQSAMFMYGVDVLASLSDKTLESKYNVFRSFGWTNSDIKTMARKLPHCLKLSEERIRSGLRYFMEELGYEPEYLASHPKLLMHSMEKRVIPRYMVLQVLKGKNLRKTNPALYTVVCISESKFLEEYVMPYRVRFPPVYEAYVNNKMGSLMEVSK